MNFPKELDEILLVEDNPGDVRLIKEKMAEAGWEVTLHKVSDGPDALDFLYQRGEYSGAPRPDVILLDLHLTRMDGEEVLEELDGDLKDIPTVAISGSQQGASLKLQDIEDEVDACLTKPLEPEDLEEAAENF